MIDGDSEPARISRFTPMQNPEQLQTIDIALIIFSSFYHPHLPNKTSKVIGTPLGDAEVNTYQIFFYPPWE